MDKLLELVLKNPIILFLVGAWLIGMITNVTKARKKAQERREASTRPQPVPKSITAQQSSIPQGSIKAASQPSAGSGLSRGMGTGQRKALTQQRQAPVAARGQRSITPTPMQAPVAARSPAPAAGTASSPQQVAAEMRRILGLSPEPAAPAPRPASPPPLRREPELIPVDPASVKLRDSRVDSHVGEQMRDRHIARSMVGRTSSKRGKIGNLGGRVNTARRVRPVAKERRFALDELRKAIVINEILMPPVSMRERDQRRPI